MGFRPHGILPSLKVRLGGKTIALEVEVVDAPLDYNLYWEGIGCIVCKPLRLSCFALYAFLIMGRL